MEWALELRAQGRGPCPLPTAPAGVMVGGSVTRRLVGQSNCGGASDGKAMALVVRGLAAAGCLRVECALINQGYIASINQEWCMWRREAGHQLPISRGKKCPSLVQ